MTAEFLTLVRERGTDVALTRLEELAATDGSILSDAHNIAHSIGKYSFTHYGSAPKAFGLCRETFQSGCYHGVLEAYFQSVDEVTAAQVRGLCDEAAGSGSAAVVKFQCFHGLGHGLTANFEHDIFEALTFCDYLPTEWDQRSCYGGVFMENVVFAREHYFGITDGNAARHDHVGEHKAYVKADDPLYPCSAVGDKYKDDCYMMQTSIMLMANGYNFAEGFKTCDTAPSRYQPTCYQSMGRDISGQTLRDSARSLEMCMLGGGMHRGYCFVGAVKNFIDIDWKVDKAMPFCASVPAENKAQCYTAIGEQLSGIHQDTGAREAECAKAEIAYRQACRTGAQLTRQT